MFDGITELELAEREISERDCFILFYLFIYFMKWLIFLFVSF